MTRKPGSQVSHSDVSAAIARFLKDGGMIKKLPEQKAMTSGTVGADKYEAFETLSDLSKVADGGDRLN